jgi:uncharacterized protein YcnI
MRTPRVLTAALIGFGLILATATPAAAHIQVLPTTAAPNDSVLFEVVVPNEREQGTAEVELAVPADVIPFGYEETPGWRRSVTLKPNGAIRSIVWKGNLRSDGFARFAFLASTPPQDGEIAWKAIQTYDDGRKVRWIGPRDGDSPAAFTTVSKRFARQNVGGEGEGGAPSGQAAPDEPETDTDGPDDTSDGSDTTARWVAAAALAIALASLLLVILRRGRPGRPAAREEAGREA